MKIRIFALAKELDMDSKLLIDYCQRLGIDIKNSPLASISPEEKDRVLALIKQGPLGSEAAPKTETLAPTREAPRNIPTKVPKLKTAAPRTPALRRPSDSESETVAPPVPEIPSQETTSHEASPPERRTLAVPHPHPAPHSPPTRVEPPVSSPAVPQEEVEAPTDASVPEAPAEEPQETERPAAARESMAPLRREDYVPAAGTGLRAHMNRETAGDGSGKGRSKPRGRPGPALPKLAEPPPAPKSATPATPVVAEAAAQKPDLRFSKEVISGERKPLTEHLRQHAEEKKKKKGRGDTIEEVPDEPVKRGPGKGPVRPAAAAGVGLIGERMERQKRRAKGVGLLGDEEEAPSRKSRGNRPKRHVAAPAAVKTVAQIEPPITVRSLSEALGRPAKELMRTLMQKGVITTVNSTLDEEVALELALEFGLELEIKRERNIEDELNESIGVRNAENVVARAPIVTILGHVDHGKTTLLDKIRSANVAAGEVGGITQHIAAYQVEQNGKRITFLDTPGHAAFGEMRARGANVTDVAVLVVAANDGVMPQTVEAINHAKAAGVPIVVALNKFDLPEKNEQRVLQDLAQHNILAAEWGGDTEVVRTSGLTGHGISDLLETLLTIAELGELTADANRPAHGVCLEAFLNEGRGVLAWLIVQDGTLRKGDVVLCGPAFGRIRNIYNDQDQEVEEAGPSTPVRVAGLDIIPGAGDHFFVMDDLEAARVTAEKRRDRGREVQLAQRGKPRTLQDILNSAQTGEIQDLPLIIKADTPGSVEALKGELLKFQHPEVRVNILHVGVGGVNESDVYLASASGAIIVAFHVVPEDRAQLLADREGVEIRQYGIIYEVTDDIKMALEGMLRPEKVEVPTGRAVVLQTFQISRFGLIAGCRVLNGTIERSNRVHVVRDQRILNDYNILSLKRNKDDAKEVKEGMECGIRLEGFDDIKEGDIFQAYRVQEVKRTL